MELETTDGVDWGSWAANIGDKLVSAVIDAEVNYPNQLARLKIERLGSNGYYTEGKLTSAGSIAGIPPTLLLIGAAVAVYLLVKG